MSNWCLGTDVGKPSALRLFILLVTFFIVLHMQAGAHYMLRHANSPGDQYETLPSCSVSAIHLLCVSCSGCTTGVRDAVSRMGCSVCRSGKCPVTAVSDPRPCTSEAVPPGIPLKHQVVKCGACCGPIMQEPPTPKTASHSHTAFTCAAACQLFVFAHVGKIRKRI